MLVSSFLEKRAGHRIDIPFSVFHSPFFLNAKKQPEMVESQILNVSSVGVLFKSNIVYNVDIILRIEILLGNWDLFKVGFSSSKQIYQGQPFVALAKVVRIEKNDNSDNYFMIAASFISVDEGHQFAVEKFINKLIKKGAI
ncbi:MAG: hypothetical protein ACD_79C00644G0003 [uncultured bacterium]|nr:MAG: hypothetical protein ACD_79C00644G0003 [uncultured bacterium]